MSYEERMEEYQQHMAELRAGLDRPPDPTVKADEIMDMDLVSCWNPAKGFGSMDGKVRLNDISFSVYEYRVSKRGRPYRKKLGVIQNQYPIYVDPKQFVWVERSGQ